jgi:predicted SAM-dependent methyltransferase
MLKKLCPKNTNEFINKVKPELNTFLSHPEHLKHHFMAMMLDLLSDCCEQKMIESFEIKWNGKYNIKGFIKFEDEDNIQKFNLDFNKEL